jgi:hypothetical protein
LRVFSAPRHKPHAVSRAGSPRKEFGSAWSMRMSAKRPQSVVAVDPSGGVKFTTRLFSVRPLGLARILARGTSDQDPLDTAHHRLADRVRLLANAILEDVQALFS